MDNAGKSGSDRQSRAHLQAIGYGFNVIYLTVVFASFRVHQRLVLAAHGITCTHYWVALVEAMILGKAIMVGGVFRLGRGLEDKPLIYPTLYQALVFAISVAAFRFVDYTIRGLVAGDGISGGLLERTGLGSTSFLRTPSSCSPLRSPCSP